MDDIAQRHMVLTGLKRHELAGTSPVLVETLREELGIGPVDIRTTLTVLAEEGTAQLAESPDGPIAGLTGGAAAAVSPAGEPPMPQVPATREPSPAEQAEQIEALAARHPELASALAQQQAQELAAVPAEARSPRDVVLTLTQAVASSLHPEVLGSMVAAGCAEAEEAGSTFVLEVLP